MKDRKLLSLYCFYAMYFIAIGVTTFGGKYYGEIGLNDRQIGLIGAVPAVVALFAQPVWGEVSDRVSQKKKVLFAALISAGVIAFLVQPTSGMFLPLLLVLTLLNTATLPVLPVGNAIAIEYTRENGHDFGPVRMMGTIGYQVSILLTGFLFVSSLKNLYPVYGVFLFLSAVCALLLPPVRGYQHEKEHISFTVLFRDRKLLLLFGLVFIAEMGSQFYLTFFSKHLGELGVANSVIGIVTVFSVALEIPFLMFGDRLMKRMPIWKWLWIGLLGNSLRFGLLAIVKSPVLIILAQIPAVTMFACFEFFPAIYLSEAVPKELRGTVQNTYQMVAFGLSRIAGTLLGGFAAEHFGIARVFGLDGAVLLVAAVIMFVPLRKQWRAAK